MGKETRGKQINKEVKRGWKVGSDESETDFFFTRNLEGSHPNDHCL